MKTEVHLFDEVLIDLDIFAFGFVSLVSLLAPSATVVPRRPDPLEPAPDIFS